MTESPHEAPRRQPVRPEDEVAFCQRCGSAMRRREAFGRSRPCCPDCGFVFFAQTANAAVAVVAAGRRVLMVRRGIQPFRGRWGFPGGFQEYGEPLHETAARETREEAGIEVEVGRVLFVGLTTDDPRKRVNVVVYLAQARDRGRAVDAQVAAADDATDVRFFDLDAVPERVAFENNRLVLEQLRREFPSGPIH